MSHLTLTAPPALRGPGPIIAATGDSKIANGAQSGTIASNSLQTGVPGDLGPRNYPMWAALLSPASAKIQYGRMAAQGGETAAQTLTRIQAALAATPSYLLPHYLLVDVGTNDVSALTDFPTVKQTFTSIYATAVSYGATPIVATQPPRDNDLGSLRTYLIKLNNWLTRTARLNGWPLLDVHAAVVDTSNGNWTSGYSADGIHPNSTGAKVIGQALADLAGNPAAGKPGVLRGLSPAYLATSQVDTFSQVLSGGAANQLFLTDTNADGLADGWSSISGSPTFTLTTDATNFMGKAQSVTRTAADGVMAAAASLAATADDVVLLSCRFNSTVEATSSNIQLELLSNPSQATVPFRLNSWDKDIPWSTLHIPITVPSLGSDTGLLPRVRAKGSAGSQAKLAQFTFANLTANGST
jgi:lysophospholipase L1-like esterase